MERARRKPRSYPNAFARFVTSAPSSTAGEALPPETFRVITDNGDLVKVGPDQVVHSGG